MILLQSANRYRRLGVLDPNSGHIDWQSRNKNFDPPRQSIHGSFSKIGRRTLCLYRCDGSLHFRVDDRDFVISDDTTISIKDLRFRRRRLSVQKNEQEIFQIVYFRPINLLPSSIDPTPFVDEEDFDFGLFAYNVINNPDRRSGIYQFE